MSVQIGVKYEAEPKDGYEKTAKAGGPVDAGRIQNGQGFSDRTWLDDDQGRCGRLEGLFQGEDVKGEVCEKGAILLCTPTPDGLVTRFSVFSTGFLMSGSEDGRPHGP